MIKEPEFIVILKLGYRGKSGHDGIAEYFYRIRRGSRKVAEVWQKDGEIKKAYDRHGRATTVQDMTAIFPGKAISAHTIVAFLILQNAFDYRTALDWCGEISFKFPMPIAYAGATKVFRRAELFELILDARQLKVAR